MSLNGLKIRVSRGLCSLRGPREESDPCPRAGFQRPPAFPCLAASFSFFKAISVASSELSQTLSPPSHASLFHFKRALCFTGLPWWLRQSRLCLQCRKPGFNPWVGKIPWRREWQPTPVLPEEFHGQKSLADYKPGGGKESDMTE